jgi:hypothetical protein
MNMKRVFFIVALLLANASAFAQEPAPKSDPFLDNAVISAFRREISDNKAVIEKMQALVNDPSIVSTEKKNMKTSIAFKQADNKRLQQTLNRILAKQDAEKLQLPLEEFTKINIGFAPEEKQFKSCLKNYRDLHQDQTAEEAEEKSHQACMKIATNSPVGSDQIEGNQGSLPASEIGTPLRQAFSPTMSEETFGSNSATSDPKNQ